MQESNKVANARLKTKPLPGTKIRCVDDGGYSFITHGKIYEVVPHLDGEDYYDGFWMIDDDGDRTWYSIGTDKDKYELVQEEETQMNNTNTTKTAEQTPDEFKVGDVVYCLIYGKGKVTQKYPNQDYEDTYPLGVEFGDDCTPTWYTLDGKFSEAGNRCLFFSEPKIEASVKRPFTPTLVGKTVVLELEEDYYVVKTVYIETENKIYVDNSGGYYNKEDILSVHEIYSENLLKP